MEKNEGMEPKRKQYPAVDVTVTEVKSDPVNSSTAQAPRMSGP